MHHRMLPLQTQAAAGTWLGECAERRDRDGRLVQQPESLLRHCICSATNPAAGASGAPSAKYYSFTTTVTVSPMVLKSVLCPGGNCTYTLAYSERFQ